MYCKQEIRALCLKVIFQPRGLLNKKKKPFLVVHLPGVAILYRETPTKQHVKQYLFVYHGHNSSHRLRLRLITALFHQEKNKNICIVLFCLVEVSLMGITGGGGGGGVL